MEEDNAFFASFIQNSDEGATATEENTSAKELLDQLVEEKEVKAEVPEAIEETTSDSDDHLFSKIEKYLEEQRAELKKYAKTAGKDSSTQDNVLVFFDKMNQKQSMYPNTKGTTSGGMYFQWENSGVVVNPGEQFLQEFHQKGQHITQIQHVIITKDCQKCYQGIFEIYDLVQKYNEVAQTPHIIQYHINEVAYRHLTPYLKPKRKEERNTLHLLDFFPDSKQLETYALSDSLLIHYYPLNQTTPSAPLSYGIQFELNSSNSNESSAIKMTYVAGGMLSKEMVEAFTSTDILIVGCDTPEDSALKQINTLTEVLEPQLLLVTGFTQEMGDMRVEVVRALRSKDSSGCSILPIDCGFQVDLDTFGIKCADDKEWVDPAQVRVLSSAKPYGPLEYFADYNLL